MVAENAVFLVAVFAVFHYTANKNSISLSKPLKRLSVKPEKSVRVIHTSRIVP